MKTGVFACSYEGCDRTFSWRAHQTYHERTHVGIKDVKCSHDGCEKVFYTKQQLAVHTRSHTGEKPFRCVECKKKFTTAGNLKNHIRTHTGERPYECTEEGCTKRFAESSSLRKHAITHNGLRQYLCHICGRVFSQSGSRNVHLKRHKHSIDLSCSLLNFEGKYYTPVDRQEGATEGANVVVISQPKEMDAMATSLHNHDDHIFSETIISADFDHEEVTSKSLGSHVLIKAGQDPE